MENIYQHTAEVYQCSGQNLHLRTETEPHKRQTKRLCSAEIHSLCSDIRSKQMVCINTEHRRCHYVVSVIKELSNTMDQKMI